MLPVLDWAPRVLGILGAMICVGKRIQRNSLQPLESRDRVSKYYPRIIDDGQNVTIRVILNGGRSTPELTYAKRAKVPSKSQLGEGSGFHKFH